jgi:TRAP-type uncharacterized transport system fused permease subunit
VLLERGHLFLPLVIIIGAAVGLQRRLRGAVRHRSVVPTTWLRASTRRTFTPAAIVEALEAGARNTVVVALACACAGIVIGTITLTGLGLSFTGVVLALSQNSLLLALLLTMVAGILLGMGLPTTPAYIVQVALLVPALVKLGRAGRGGAPVRAVLRGAVGDHAAGGDGGLRRQRHLARTLMDDQLGRGEARADRLHHPVHVRLRAVAAADRRWTAVC